jgi:hypothetical protein
MLFLYIDVQVTDCCLFFFFEREGERNKIQTKSDNWNFLLSDDVAGRFVRKHTGWRGNWLWKFTFEEYDAHV